MSGLGHFLDGVAFGLDYELDLKRDYEAYLADSM